MKQLSFIFLIILGNTLYAQLPSSSFSFNCTKDTFVNCNATCINLRAKVPAVNSLTDNYRVRKEDCFRPNVSPATPGVSLNGTQDDRYSPVISFPFPFSFFGSVYNSAVISTNGIVSFDVLKANMMAQWSIPTLAGSLPNANYERAIIMAPFHDIDISRTESPERQIKYEVVGTAPHRKWIVSFYKVPCYDCYTLINNTYQVTLYEGLSLVEVHVFGREVCNTWNSGAAMVGMQNYNRDKGIMAPGRTAFTSPRWGGVNMNEAWLFSPTGGAPLLKKVELYRSTGEFVATGDTVNDGNGSYNVTFNNVCPGAPATQYIVKSVYKNINDTSVEIYGTDTVNVSLLAAAVPTVQVQNACPGSSNGSITITSPVGNGYEYSLGGFAYQSSPVFDQLAYGMYTVSVRNNAAGCNVLSMAVPVYQGYQQNTSVNYGRNVYCNSEMGSPTPVINGVAGGTFTASPSGLNINSNTGAINLAASDTGNYTLTYHITSGDSCVNPIATTSFRIVDNTQFVWTGAVDNNWENPANWSCNNLPTNTSDVFIYNGTVVISSNITVNKLTIAPGVNFTVSPGYNLTIVNPGP